ncbi:hypothetical protein AQUCO_04500176v1 [Aquilegia coerulea]|uniref:RING-type E3 ubiquitin transferase n=1 Tax=Aquilegia coerulea TaxID=218851 RepID=A0A2G5CM78_AQUCA|nr:hypothetical protein AQUCO_04500176v1 [Aquilegia coerulea]
MSNSSCKFIPLDINSNDGKLMFAAIISLLLVISFVLLLHAYARWVFVLGQSADRRRLTALSLSTTTTITTTTTGLHHHLPTDDNNHMDLDDDEKDGLDSSIITSIPIFVHKSDGSDKCILECAICLSMFEDEDIGRHLPSCNHAFHVQCIDKWLRSHSSCPICRALVGSKKTTEVKSIMPIDDEVIQDRTDRTHVHSHSPGNEGPALEVVIEMPPLESNSECNAHNSSPSSPPPTPPSAPPLPQLRTGYYLKRILSMNRSENKVFPSSSNVNDMNV